MPRKKSLKFALRQVHVRMYRPGLGDCFLITFSGVQEGNPVERHMMVDCGVLTGTTDGSERLGKIIMDIQQRTQGKLDILVVTHEHADHLSGFDDHQEIFNSKFEIGEVWLGWTEDKDDPEVKEMYSAVRKVPLQVLERALEELKKANSPNYPYYKQLTQFLKDNGMDAVKNIALDKHKEPVYLRPEPDKDGPTKVITRADFGGVRFHVLAPPSDPALLSKSDPPKSRLRIDKGEAINQSTAFALAVLKRSALTDNALSDDGYSTPDVAELFELSLPFDPILGIPLESLKTSPSAGNVVPEEAQSQINQFYRQFYLQPLAEEEVEADWRRIDSDWLEAAGSLALYLDGDLNNTSLVLAIELGEGGKVLLFPGDAQYGNWQSWAISKRGSDLLKRTVFYKVGHHGSHNATLKQGGLSLMGTAEEFNDLIAMIPVDTQKARTKRGWVMPEPELKEMLLKQSRGRVIIACEGSKEGQFCDDISYQVSAQPPPGTHPSPQEWADFRSAIKVDKLPDCLWVEYTLSV